MRVYCKKCKKITNGFSVGRDILKLKCGCKITRKEAEEYRIYHKITYYLKDGRIIRNKYPKKKPEYVIAETEHNEDGDEKK